MNGNGHRLWTLALVVITGLIAALTGLVSLEFHRINERIDAVRDYVLSHQQQEK